MRFNSAATRMRKFAILILFLALSLSTANAQELVPITKAEIAAVQSNTVVTGTVVVENPELCELPNSAIINDKIVWESQTVTVSKDGRVITLRSQQEHIIKAPSLRLVKVNKGIVTLEYARDGLKPHIFKKLLKPRARR